MDRRLGAPLSCLGSRYENRKQINMKVAEENRVISKG